MSQTMIGAMAPTTAVVRTSERTAITDQSDRAATQTIAIGPYQGRRNGSGHSHDAPRHMTTSIAKTHPIV